MDAIVTRGARNRRVCEYPGCPNVFYVGHAAGVPLEEQHCPEHREDHTAAATCMVCGHEWERHDPEDGRCDSFAVDGSGVCQCGRDLAFHQKWNAYLSRMALGKMVTPDE